MLAAAVQSPNNAQHLLPAAAGIDLKTDVALLLFALASILQHTCHAHLASLKKYSLPTHFAFRMLVCPHYFAECMIYLSLAVVATPQKEIFNTTLLSGLLFVVVNLGITAQSSRQWYAQKFGEAAVAAKWNMIPYVF